MIIMYQLLFIDDDADLLRSNQKYFTKAGYAVKTAETPQAALELLGRCKPDCIVLDVMLPSMSGFELYPRLRALTSAPVIFLSGRTGERDKVGGLLLGGADYMTKPYSLRELAARIQVQLRGAGGETASVLSYPPFSLDLPARKAYCRNEEIPLSNMEYQLLRLLVSRPNEVLSFETIGMHVWEYYTVSQKRTIMVNISRLRKKLEHYDGLENAIESVWSTGYKFVGDRRLQR